MRTLFLFQFFERIFKNPVVVDIIIALSIILLSILFGKFLNFLFRVILKPLFRKTKTALDDRIIDLLIKFDNRIFIVLGLYLGFNYFSNRVKNEKGLKKLLSEEIYNFLMGFTDVVFHILFIAAIIVAIYVISRLFNLFVDYYVEKKNLVNTRGTLQDFVPLLRKIFLIIIIVIGILVVLNRFNVNVSGIIVSLGVGSLAIALAAQETLANMIAGFVILIDRPFREGDRIRLPSGEVGDVFEIGMRSTKILDFDNNLIIVPNSELVKTKIQNITYPDYVSRVLVDVDVAYNSNIDLAKRILIEIAKTHPLTLPDFEPLVFLTKFSQNGVTLRLISRTADYRNIYQIESDFRDSILRRFSENKIEIPYLQVVIRKPEN